MVLLLPLIGVANYGIANDVWNRAQNGHAKSQVNVGLWYLHGRAGREQNCELAKRWFLKAVQQGYEGGAALLYAMYSGVSIFCEEDDAQAKEWLMFVAGSGNANYQWSLARSYMDGTYGEVDEDKAMFWLQKAVQQGYSLAESDLKKLMLKVKN